MTTRNSRKTRNAAARKRLAAAAATAGKVRDLLGLQTLETRGRDDLDFHDISVTSIRDAIQLAFEAGWDAGYEAGESLNK